jgi:hypothetical protein
MNDNGGIAARARDLLRHPAGAGGRNARKDAFFARQAAAHVFGVVLAHSTSSSTALAS